MTANEVDTDSHTSRKPLTVLASFAAKHWPVVIVAWLVILGLGAYSYNSALKREGFPPIDIPIAVTGGAYLVNDPAIVDQQVTLPLSEAYLELDEVKEVQSFARANEFTIVIEFNAGVSSEVGGNLLREVNQNAGLAPEVFTQVIEIDATKFLNRYDTLITIKADADTTAEEFEAEASKLAAVLEGGTDIESVEVQPLITTAVNPMTGQAESLRTRYIRVATKESQRFENAIAIGLIRSDEAEKDLLTFSDEIADVVENQDVLSGGFTAAVSADFANDVRTQVSSLTTNLLQGLLAVAVVSYLLIGWRVSVVTALFMVTVMMASLLVLWLLGYTLNTITLFSLILTLGLLVDDAIVISESIDANRSASANPVTVVRKAIDSVAIASGSGTLTTVLVFAPLAFVTGVLGKFIRAIPVTVITALILSYLFSVTLIPALVKPFILRGKKSGAPLESAQSWLADKLALLAGYPARNGTKGFMAGVAAVVIAVGFIAASFGVATQLGFNIFPPTKDTNQIWVTTSFAPTTTIEEAETHADAIDQKILDVVGKELSRSQYIDAGATKIDILIDLTPFPDRDITAPEIVAQLKPELDQIEGALVSVRTVDIGPPVESLPFATQITVEEGKETETLQLAKDIQSALIGAELAAATPTDIVASVVTTEGLVYRIDALQQAEIRAAFSTDDLTSNLAAAKTFVESEFDSAELKSRGLDASAIKFDYGQESDMQEDFASLGDALLVALALTLLLLVLQLRSVIQPLLIFLAVPFSFFGVFVALKLTNNPLSFFVGVGFIALIGVVVNNTILLIDAANQARRQGMSSGDAIADATRRRFRPLVATTATTVVGLVPLALSDPFWESLAMTLIGGLLSSTLLVLVSFPVIYLFVAATTKRITTAFKKSSH